ncbi:cell division protein FtsK, partial [Levilactobacillus brevis]|nr:cell division protein FtsK [Levilactobacillus brevis]
MNFDESYSSRRKKHMEHYDGPAFYRKFPVKPTPEQMDDTTDERSERQVRLRKERGERLQLREQRERQREQQAAASAQAALQQAKPQQSTATTAQRQTTTADVPDYRPFVVTQVPRQLHWNQTTAKSRQRYRRLIKQLHKTDQSFLLFGAATNTDVADSTSVDAVSLPSGQAVLLSEAA